MAAEKAEKAATVEAAKKEKAAQVEAEKKAAALAAQVAAMATPQVARKMSREVRVFFNV